VSGHPQKEGGKGQRKGVGRRGKKRREGRGALPDFYLD